MKRKIISTQGVGDWKNLPDVSKIKLDQWGRPDKGVHHVDRFFQLTDAKLAFDQHQLCKRMMDLISLDNMSRNQVDELELATELCAQYTEVIKQRVSNYEKQWTCLIHKLPLYWHFYEQIKRNAKGKRKHLGRSPYVGSS